jgi:hypothetical protein
VAAGLRGDLPEEAVRPRHARGSGLRFSVFLLLLVALLIAFIELQWKSFPLPWGPGIR